jgi:hypothetical protein
LCIQGRQSKGQSLAIELLSLLRQQHPELCVNLALVGQTQPGYEAYDKALRTMGAPLGVEFHFNASPEDLRDVLGRTTVQWHLTGAMADAGDPASFEHFGISIVESMAIGALPVVLDKGGPREIVTRAVGRAVSHVEGIIPATVELLTMRVAERLQMSQAAKKRARLYSYSNFWSLVNKLVYRGVKDASMELQIHAAVQRRGRDEFTAPKKIRAEAPQACAGSRQCAVLLVEFREHHRVGFAIQNTLAHVGKHWKLHVVTLQMSSEYFVDVLDAVLDVSHKRAAQKNTSGTISLAASSDAADLWTVTSPPSTNTDFYSDLLKNPGFWNSFPQEGILVFQVDTLMLPRSKFSIYDFTQFDYIGAPWCRDNNVLQPLLRDGTIKSLVGNGGFSWRKKSIMTKCIAMMQGTYDQSEPEDRFFVRCFSTCLECFKLAEPEQAKHFALEVPCDQDDLASELARGIVPLALHSAWYYTDDALMSRLLFT